MRNTTRQLAVLFGATFTLSACDSSYAPTDAGQGGGATVSPPTTQLRKSLKERDDVQIVSGTGDISATVQQYRDLFGGGAPNPNTAVEFGSGRREINWDGVRPRSRTTICSRQTSSIRIRREGLYSRPTALRSESATRGTSI